ncbi:S-4TM family putative pore-forming effector [Micromonospora lupini]|uniref:S-4TM family putative pore-forming effector n=1 Tax=Micromonospora lupini TaxID=285679 RepID=UPI002257A050|nr:S-4TM family putative pore-forming effector [Micromonospora lupini]MCX5069461.1 S-4TM family putative pore-forming effector [Micromonospora lupini]
MTESTQSLLQRQRRPEMMALLHAMSVCHGRAQRLDNLRMALSVAIGVAGAVVAFTSVSALAVTAVGALWAVVNAIGLGSWSAGQIRRAATLQEMFDVRLFELPWNAVAAGEPVGPEEVSRLDRAYRGDERYLRDYYEVPPLPRPYDVLACQHQNLGWGARVRRRYAYTVLAGVALWTAVGVVFAVTADLTVADLLTQWFVPSLGALLLGVEIYRGQRDVAAERDRALVILQRRIAAAVHGDETRTDPTLLTLARQTQDLIFQSRRGQARVPDWFFRRFHAADRVDFQAAMTNLADLLRARPPSARTE